MDDLTSALEKLEKASSEVARLGAVTGQQWTRLSIALLGARSAIAKAKASA